MSPVVVFIHYRQSKLYHCEILLIGSACFKPHIVFICFISKSVVISQCRLASVEPLISDSYHQNGSSESLHNLSVSFLWINSFPYFMFVLDICFFYLFVQSWFFVSLYVFCFQCVFIFHSWTTRSSILAYVIQCYDDLFIFICVCLFSSRTKTREERKKSHFKTAEWFDCNLAGNLIIWL